MGIPLIFNLSFYFCVLSQVSLVTATQDIYGGVCDCVSQPYSL